MFTFMFFILRVSGGALFIDAKRHIWFTGTRGLFAFFLSVSYYRSFCCEVLQLNLSLKYYSNGTLNKFWRYNRKKPLENPDFKHHTKSALGKTCNHSSMKRFPLRLWQEIYFLCNGESVIKLVRRRNTSILEQTL